MWLSAKAEKAAGEETGIRSRNRLQGGWQRPARHLPPAPAHAIPHPCCAIPSVPAEPRGCPTGSVRTAGVVGGRVHVVEVQAAGFGHLQVHHVRGVLQGGHRLLVPHVLQVGVIHLPGAWGAVRWWLSPPAAPSQQGSQEKGPGMGTVALRVPGCPPQARGLPPAAGPRSAGARPSGQRLPR